jgi:hypothetical protein
VSEDTPVRRRVASSVVSRQARETTRPFVAVLAEWQARIAFLRGAASKPSLTTNAERASLRHEVDDLTAEIHAQQLAFTRACQLLPADVAQSGHIVDTTRAMNSASGALETIRAVLSTPPR